MRAVAASTGGGFCFSGDATAEVEGKGTVSMKELSLGNRVRVEGNKFEPIYSFGHYDPNVRAEYLKITTESGAQLTISKHHMVFAETDGAVPASSLKVGDKVVMASNSLDTIKTIKTVLRQGAFAPFTSSGTIIVNGVKASSYVAFQDSPVLLIGGFSTGLTYQWLAHAFELPHRMWCSVAASCKNETYVDGVSAWVYLPNKIAAWFVRQDALVMAIVAVPVLAAFALLGLLELMMQYPFVIMTVLTGTLIILTLGVKK
jgi:hypothetical protein